MNTNTISTIEHQSIELGGINYVVLRESVFAELCRAAGVPQSYDSLGDGQQPASLEAGINLDRASLAEKIKRRRQSSGLSQAELARRAGIRPETLNRIERGRTTPDFSTVRKLVIAMNATEKESMQKLSSSTGDDDNGNDK